MNEIVVVRPIIEGDEVTLICYEEAQEVIEYARAKGWKVTDIAGKEAVRGKVEEVLRGKPGVLVCHYDHGREDAWIGSDGRACVDLDNVQLLANRECYAQNCSSAAKLGVDAWKLRATYWGYREVYVFTVDEKEYFKQFNNYGVKLRIDGSSWREAFQKTKELADKLVDELVRAGRALAAACLRHDADALVLYDEEHQPSSGCPLRKLTIKLLGPRAGWRVPRKYGLALLLFGSGAALYIHDRICEWTVLGSRLHGLDVGVFALALSFIIVSFDFVKWLKRRWI